MSEHTQGKMNERLLIRTLIVGAIVVCWVSVARIGAGRTLDLTTASIADISAAFDAGALTSERLTQLYLARCHQWSRRRSHSGRSRRIAAAAHCPVVRLSSRR
jgi:hypothetical protein